MTLAEYMNSQFSLVQDLEFFIRILAACLCGAGIGVERSKRLKEAGIRTHIIVCCAAALMMIVSKYGFVDLTNTHAVVYNGTRGADPARIAAQVVSGVGFLGAGVIFKNGSTIKGLTTAAGIWATAGIGLAIGSGMYVIGIFTTIVIALLQVVMHRFTVGADSLVTSRLQFTVVNRREFRERFTEYIEDSKMQVVQSKIDFDDEGYAVYDVVLRTTHDVTLQELDLFLEDEGVRSIRCTPVA